MNQAVSFECNINSHRPSIRQSEDQDMTKPCLQSFKAPTCFGSYWAAFLLAMAVYSTCTWRVNSHIHTYILYIHMRWSGGKLHGAPLARTTHHKRPAAKGV